MEALLRRVHRRARDLREVLKAVTDLTSNHDLALVLLHVRARDALEGHLARLADIASGVSPEGLLGGGDGHHSVADPQFSIVRIAAMVGLLENAALHALTDARRASAVAPAATPAEAVDCTKASSRSPAFDTLIADLGRIYREVTGNEPRFSDRQAQHDTPRRLTSQFGNFALAVLALLAATPGPDVLQNDPQWRPIRDRSMDSVREAWRRRSGTRPVAQRRKRPI